MTINVDQDKHLAMMQPEVLKIRTVIKGAPFVKMAGQVLLPSPNEVDKTSAQALTQYNKYKAGAEFDEYTTQTLTSMIGKLNLDDFTPELDSGIEYLINDFDGDGCTLKGAVESFASNVLAVNWHIAAAEYMGLQGVPLEDISKADAEKLNPRATVKQYPRESVVKAHFSTINGKRQLSFIMLAEHGQVFDQESYITSEVVSYIILALDENGDYYQQKLVKSDEGGISEGERDYVTVSGKPLKFIPIQIISSQEINHDLPQQLGFLNPIADKCLHMYNATADYKEALRKFVPTNFVEGATQQDIDGFPEANGGREYIQLGGTNFLLGDMKVNVVAADGSLIDFRQYKEDAKNDIRSLGGVIPEYSQGDTTATEALINSAEQNAVLNPLVSGIEMSTKKLLAYCAMFEGLTTQDNVNNYAESIYFDMPRDFSKVAPNTEAGRFVIEMVNSRLMTIEQATKKLIALGWHEGDLKEIIDQVENIEPAITIEDDLDEVDEVSQNG